MVIGKLKTLCRIINNSSDYTAELVAPERLVIKNLEGEILLDSSSLKPCKNNKYVEEWIKTNITAYKFKDLGGFKCLLRERNLYRFKGNHILLASSKGGITLSKDIIQNIILKILKDFLVKTGQVKSRKSFYDFYRSECFIDISRNILKLGIV